MKHFYHDENRLNKIIWTKHDKLLVILFDLLFLNSIIINKISTNEEKASLLVEHFKRKDRNLKFTSLKSEFTSYKSDKPNDDYDQIVNFIDKVSKELI